MDNVMVIARLCGLVLAGLVTAVMSGCATQSRASQVGEIGFNPRHERELQATLEAEQYYAYKTPKTAAVIYSNPAGAHVEWYNSEGKWVSVGNTPTDEIVIEATGKPELFRVSSPGFLPEIRWVAATPSSEGTFVEFILEPDLLPEDYILDDRR